MEHTVESDPPITLTELRTYLKQINEKAQNFITNSKGQEPVRVISELEGKIFMEFSWDSAPHQALGPKARLILQDMRILLESREKDWTLELTGALGKKGSSWFSSVEIKECEFILPDNKNQNLELTFSFASFHKINFEDNKRSDVPIVIEVKNFHDLRYASPIHVANNILNGLSINILEEYDRSSASILAFMHAQLENFSSDALYRRILIENNRVCNFLRMTVKSNGYERLVFSLHKNKIDRLLLWAGPTDKEKKEMSKEEETASMSVSGSHSLNMASGNIIEVIEVEGRKPQVAGFSLQERIGEGILEGYEMPNQKGWDVEKGAAKTRIESNRRAFSLFKKIAVDENQKVLEQVMNYYIAKLDGLLLDIDGWPWKDRLIFLVGWLFSKHGTSWTRPLVWMLVITILSSYMIGLLLYGHIGTDIIQLDVERFNKFITLFLFSLSELVNPLGTPQVILWKPWEIFSVELRTVDTLSKLSSVIIGAVFFLVKAIYAMCVYEFVRAARRFTIK